MANLEAKTKMSPLQLALAVASTGIGGQLILGSNKIVTDGAHMTWLGIVLGGILFYSVTLMMVKLGDAFPNLTFVDYMPMLWGRLLGSIIVWWYMITLILQVCTILTGFRKATIFFMFNRTPPEVVALGMLIVCVYCALQDWGTFLRIQQYIFLAATTLFILLWFVSLFSFSPENLLPLWSKKDLPKLLRATLESWNMYGGYEIVLFLLPLTCRGKVSIAKALGGAFGCMTFTFLSIIIIAVGVLTLKGVTSTIYPTMTAMKSVELPGTFLERLETYLVLSWIPVVFDTLAIYIWLPAKILMQKTKYADHRPFVLLLAPLLYFGANLLESLKILEDVGKLTTKAGLVFSLAIIPLSLLVLLWKKRGTNVWQR